MSGITPVSPQKHFSKYWQRFTSYRFASQSQFAPLVLLELSVAVQAMPLCFIHRNDYCHLVGLLSPVSGENYYVAPDGRWLGGYVPACFRGYPFSLERIKGNDQLALCVDESSGLISDSKGEPFFDKDGQLAKPVSDVFEFLKKIGQNRVLTQKAVDTLAEAGLLTGWDMKGATGLYKIDEPKLMSLGDDAFLTLRKRHALPIAYAQLFSMGNTAMLDRLAKIQGVAEKPPTPDIEKIFGEEDIFKY